MMLVKPYAYLIPTPFVSLDTSPTKQSRTIWISRAQTVSCSPKAMSPEYCGQTGVQVCHCETENVYLLSTIETAEAKLGKANLKV